MYSIIRPARAQVTAALVCIFLAACSANVGKAIKVSDQQMVKYGTLSVQDAISALEQRVKEAKEANMVFYAPDYYRGAIKILNDTLKSQSKKPKEELIVDITKADAILEKGHAMMATVRSRLATELAMKEQMEKDNVPKIFPKEYEDAISDLSGLIEKVELEKADKIDKEKIDLYKSMEALDIRAIQYTTLHDIKTMNEVTGGKNGEKQAPATFAEALRVFQDASNRIALAPHDADTVNKAGADAMFAARHARYVNERVFVLQNAIKNGVETVVLEEEKFLLKISDALGQQDLRDQPIEKQVNEIARFATEVVGGQQKSSQEIIAANDQSKVLETRIREVNVAMDQNNERLAEKEALLSDKETQLFEKIALISEKDTQLAAKDDQIKTLDAQIALLEEQNKALQAAKSGKTKSKVKAVK